MIDYYFAIGSNCIAGRLSREKPIKSRTHREQQQTTETGKQIRICYEIDTTIVCAKIEMNERLGTSVKFN